MTSFLMSNGVAFIYDILPIPLFTGSSSLFVKWPELFAEKGGPLSVFASVDEHIIF